MENKSSGKKLHTSNVSLDEHVFTLPHDIETERLTLRKMRASDAPGMFELDADPLVHKYLGMNPVKHIDECSRVIEILQKQYLENGIGRWAVIEKSSGNFVGWSGLKNIKETMNNHIDFYEVGYRFIRKYWGMGYATETAKASLKYGFEVMGLKEIFGIANIENLNSINVLEKSGLRRMNEFVWQGFIEIPSYWFRITREEWEQQQIKP